MDANTTQTSISNQLGQIIRDLREGAGMTRLQLCEEMSAILGDDINERKLMRFERGDNPFSIHFFLTACVCLSVENPYDVLIKAINQNLIEQDFAERFRNAMPHVRPFPFLNAEGLARVTSYAADLAESKKYAVPVKKKSSILIPLFATPASAGFGQPAENDVYEECDCDYLSSCSEKPDFAVRVSGDSMEPAIHDGQIVYACWANDEAPRNNQLGIYQVDGENFIKQYSESGERRLVSYNPKYSDILLKESMVFRFIGRVVGTETAR